MKLSRQYTAAFTMVEIAIALGVVAVALIAIIGVLPTGMQVNRDTRQDTIIHEDGAYLLQAIRSGAEGIPDLSQFAEQVNGMPGNTLTSAEIVAALATPRLWDDTSTPQSWAVFRAISGPATQRADGVPTFRYKVLCDVRQVGPVNTNLPHAAALMNNLFEVRLVFLWPLLPNTDAVADVRQKQVFRTYISGAWDATNQMFNLGQLTAP